MPFGLYFGCLDLMLEALGEILGMGWVPGWPGDHTMGWIAFTLGREHCFIRIQGTAKVEGEFGFFGLYCIPVNIRQSAIRLGK